MKNRMTSAPHQSFRQTRVAASFYDGVRHVHWPRAQVKGRKSKRIVNFFFFFFFFFFLLLYYFGSDSLSRNPHVWPLCVAGFLFSPEKFYFRLFLFNRKEKKRFCARALAATPPQPPPHRQAHRGHRKPHPFFLIFSLFPVEPPFHNSTG